MIYGGGKSKLIFIKTFTKILSALNLKGTNIMKISVKDLTKNYGEDETLVQAVKKCSFTISQGEHIAVVGPSGSGKTTLLNVMGGLDAPTTGTVSYDGEELPFDDPNKLASFRLKNIGRVFQAYDLIPELTAYENIIVPALLDSKKPDKAYIRSVTEILEIDDRLYRYPLRAFGRTAAARRYSTSAYK